MEKRIVITLLMAFAALSEVGAQSDDFGMWYELGAEKKLSQKWSIEAEAGFRTRNNTRTADRWSGGLGVSYRIAKGYLGRIPASLKASGGYSLLYDNNPEELTFNSSGDPKKWTPSYWGVRHRFNLSLAGSVDLGRFGVSLRERLQYTYRPEAKNKKYAFTYDDDDYLSGYNMEAIKGKGKNVLRSRLQVDYDIPRCKFDPFVNAEMFNDKDGIQKMRYQAGFDFKIKKQHVLSLTYRYQRVNNDDDDHETNSHLIGLGYKYKL